MAFNTFIGKTVVAIGVNDESTELQFMFSDGSAQSLYLVTTAPSGNVGAIEPGGLRAVTGVAAFLNHPITTVLLGSIISDPNAVVDGYEEMVFHSVQLNTASGNLVVEYVLNAGIPAAMPSETSPVGQVPQDEEDTGLSAGQGILTGDWVPPTLSPGFN